MRKPVFLHMRKQRRRFAVQLICAFVFASLIVQSLFFLNPKFQASAVQPGLCGNCLETTKTVFNSPVLRRRQISLHIPIFGQFFLSKCASVSIVLRLQLTLKLLFFGGEGGGGGGKMLKNTER